MPIKMIERNFWQASVAFSRPTSELTSSGLAHLFTHLPTLLSPDSGASWEFPALSGASAMLQIGPAGLQETQVAIALGTNQQGWHIELTAGRLNLRQQQEVVGFTTGDHPEKQKGERW